MNTENTNNLNRNLPLSFIKGCPFIHDGQGLFLVDLGVPVTISKTRKVMFAGAKHPCRESFAIVNAETLSDWFETEITGVVGLDLIARYSCLFDYHNGVLIVGYDGPVEGEIGALVDFMGRRLPIIHDFVLDGKPFNVVLDTGAHISYLRPELLQNRPAVETAIDGTWGLEGVHEFETQLYDVSCSCQGIEWTMRCGILPAHVQAMMAHLPVSGIVGLDLFEHCKVVFQHGKIYLKKNITIVN